VSASGPDVALFHVGFNFVKAKLKWEKINHTKKGSRVSMSRGYPVHSEIFLDFIMYFI